MIQANKGFTLSKFHQKGLDIRKHELEYFSMVFDRMSSVSGMLATFASSAMMLRVPRWKNPYLIMLFLTFTGAALGLHLIVILMSTLCSLWGPGKALRGDNGSHVHRTIEILEDVQQSAMRYFIAGLFCYFISSMMVSWIFFDQVGAVLTTGFLTLFLVVLVRQSLMIRRAFITSQKFTSGRLRGNPVKASDDHYGTGVSPDYSLT
eukprot:GEMP01039867.1.p1 GENE.GEMP01039867.1~~GEMP01039867.1.p1  ORF type:complete len:206 (+),score=23.27 GEMP01039867.1:587-1204(+)